MLRKNNWALMFLYDEVRCTCIKENLKRIYVNREDRACFICKKSISFSEFIRDNPSISELRAKEFWNDPMIAIFCPNCFFNLPERPFRAKRRNFNYHEKYQNFNTYSGFD